MEFSREFFTLYSTNGKYSEHFPVAFNNMESSRVGGEPVAAKSSKVVHRFLHFQQVFRFFNKLYRGFFAIAKFYIVEQFNCS